MCQMGTLLKYMGHGLCSYESHSVAGPRTRKPVDAVRCRYADRLRGTKAGVAPSSRGVREASTGQGHWIALRRRGAFQDRQTEAGTFGAEFGSAWEGQRRGRRASYGGFYGAYGSLDFMLQGVENQCRASGCGRTESGFHF